MEPKKPSDMLFPHEKVRETQNELIDSVSSAIKAEKNLIVHAPTGLGKTAATLAPALSYALKNDKKIFFLTSRHTQHRIVIDTLRKIKEKHNQDILVADIIGKKAMCIQPGVGLLYSGEFSEYCRSVRESGKCEFYINTKTSNKLTPRAKKVFDDLKKLSPEHIEKTVEVCSDEKLCPFEIASAMISDATVIVSDYYYIFNKSIRDMLFAKSNMLLENCIVIVDEAHNLPNRIRSLVSDRITSMVLRNAIKEAKKYKYNETIQNLSAVQDALNAVSEKLRREKEALVSKYEFMDKINMDYDQLVTDLEFIAEDIRQKQKRSWIGSVAKFLDSWKGQDKGFVRFISTKRIKNEEVLMLTYKCLDPSIVTKDVINSTHSSILMSGTLTPTEMYKDLLGVNNCELDEYDAPFPEKNKLNLIVPKTTTKFTSRNEGQFKAIAGVCSEIINKVPGNCAIFFPSYDLKDKINRYFSPSCDKTVFSEIPKLTKEEKGSLMDRFSGYNGAVLLGVTTGSFGEGIDMPGVLKCVIVVGLPLQTPDLETKELINYYQQKFGKGWDYGYIFPAISRALQAAGRCIRSETDKGVIVFLDERYAWPNYTRCFPTDQEYVVTGLYLDRIDDFFT